ncbi:hypothetical protein GGS20DRAFT_531614 [Poronia punctata]|nr:hypothetical protein GGS20DRAFT_531614 [Poronia punctata]
MALDVMIHALPDIYLYYVKGMLIIVLLLLPIFLPRDDEIYDNLGIPLSEYTMSICLVSALSDLTYHILLRVTTFAAISRANLPSSGDLEFPLALSSRTTATFYMCCSLVAYTWCCLDKKLKLGGYRVA